MNRDDVMSFYEKVFNLPHIEVIGPVQPGLHVRHRTHHDKLLQLIYKELISVKFNKKLKHSGILNTLPLIERVPY